MASREEAIQQYLGTSAPEKPAAAKKPQSKAAAIRAFIEQGDVAPPSPAPSAASGLGGLAQQFFRPLTRAGEAGGKEMLEGVKQLQPFGRGTEGPLEALGRVVGGTGKLLNAPVAAAGEFLASPALETQAGQYRPPVGTQGHALPSVADVLRALGQGGAMAGMSIPAKPRPRLTPYTEEQLAQWPSGQSPILRQQAALPPATKGVHVPGETIEGQLIGVRDYPEVPPKRLTGQPPPAGELPPHIDWRTPPPPPKMLTAGQPPRRRGAIISGPGEAPPRPSVPPEFEDVLPAGTKLPDRVEAAAAARIYREQVDALGLGKEGAKIAPETRPAPPEGISHAHAERIAKARTAKERAKTPLFAEQIPAQTPEAVKATVDKGREQFREQMSEAMAKANKSAEEYRGHVRALVDDETFAKLEAQRNILPQSPEYSADFWHGELKKRAQAAPPGEWTVELVDLPGAHKGRTYAGYAVKDPTGTTVKNYYVKDAAEQYIAARKAAAAEVPPPKPLPSEASPVLQKRKEAPPAPEAHEGGYSPPPKESGFEAHERVVYKGKNRWISGTQPKDIKPGHIEIYDPSVPMGHLSTREIVPIAELGPDPRLASFRPAKGETAKDLLKWTNQFEQLAMQSSSAKRFETAAQKLPKFNRVMNAHSIDPDEFWKLVRENGLQKQREELNALIEGPKKPAKKPLPSEASPVLQKERKVPTWAEPWQGKLVTVTDGADRGTVGTVERVFPHPTRGTDLPVLEVRTQQGGIVKIPSNMVTQGKAATPARVTPQVPTFERTKEGMQGLIEGTPDPTLKLAGQESTVFKDATRAAKEAELAKAQASLPTSGEIVKKPRPDAFLRKQGFEHGQPNLADPDELYEIIKSRGGLKIMEGEAGEYVDMPAHLKNKNGVSIQTFAEDLADRFPGLGTQQEIVEKLRDSLRRWPILKQEKAARAAAEKVAEAEAAAKAAADPMVTEIRTETPPSDIAMNFAEGEWKAMGPIERKSAIEFMRDALTDESGRLNLAQMARALHRWRTKFPMEEAVRKARPNSPVISEIERWNTSLTNWIEQRANLSWHRAVAKQNPETLKDLEQQAVDYWNTHGRTAQAEAQARTLFPIEVQKAMHQRDVLFDQANRSRQWFGIGPVRRDPGPYLPRHVDEGREAVTLGGTGLPSGRALQTAPTGHTQSRVYETYREGEQVGKLIYDDPRNQILLRDWLDLKIRATHQLFRNLEAKGGLFRDRAAAAAASPTGRPWAVENAPGGTWWTTTEAEAQFLKQNLMQAQKGPQTSLVGWANSLLRNPNLVNPAPHVVKNMAVKALLARGPVTPYVLARDAVEYFRGTNPQLLRDFKEAMPFAESGRSAGEILGAELRRGPLQDAVGTAVRQLGHLNRPSQKVIFEWADPAMRYSLYKHYRGKGMGVYEAGNHAWVDLIRYGTRSSVTDMWKSWPLNFFVPWRYGTFVSLMKQAQNHPVRTALLVGAVDYLREVRYRQTGRYFHLPWDYVTAPFAQLAQSKSAGEFAKNLGTQATMTAMFGPGGAFAASQIDDMLKLARNGPDPHEYERLAKMFWGVGQLYDVFISDKPTGGVSGALGAILLGEHNALTYQPRRLSRAFPESLPGMKKSPLVEEAERQQDLREQRKQQRQERQQQRPTPTIEERLRRQGYLR